MSFEELLSRLQQIPFDEERKHVDGYLEFVLSSRHLAHLYPVLEEYFGVPFKPAGMAPSAEAADFAKNYGGIQKHQTLYFLKEGGVGNCAMIWPWGDNTRATVKVARGTLPKKG